MDLRLGQRTARTSIIVGMFVALTACSGNAAAPTSTWPSPSSTPTTESPSASPSSPASPTPDQPTRLSEGAALVAVDDLRIRADPAIDAAEASCGNSPSSPARLGVGDVVWITDAEPRVRDAYLWYQVVASNQTCELALMAGWVAAGPADDSEWIHVFDDECPGPAAPGDLPPSPLARLECYAGERLTLHGVLPRIPDGIGFTCPGIEPTWLTCGIDTLTQAGDSEIGISIRTPPDVEAPPRGQLIVATGSFDNPRAEGCVEPARRFSTLVVEIYCRSQFIVESMASEE